jgi:hypothetical protein
LAGLIIFLLSISLLLTSKVETDTHDLFFPFCLRNITWQSSAYYLACSSSPRCIVVIALARLLDQPLITCHLQLTCFGTRIRKTKTSTFLR